MSVVHHPARVPVLLILSAILLSLFTTCIRHPVEPMPPVEPAATPAQNLVALTTKGPCADKRGSPFKAGPIICVDDVSADLSVNPDPITAWDRVSENSNAPVMLQWFTRSGENDLVIEPKSSACATQKPQCDHAGHCWAMTVPGTTGDCAYSVTVNGGKPLDPTIIITTCCS